MRRGGRGGQGREAAMRRKRVFWLAGMEREGWAAGGWAAAAEWVAGG